MDSAKISSTAIANKIENNPFSARPIYGNFSLLLLGVIFITMLPHYFKLYSAPANVPVAFVVHGIVYFAWFVLFAVQSNLIALKKSATHKKLGYFSLILLAALIISGMQILYGAMSSYDPNWDAGFLYSRINLIWGVLHTFISFIILCGLGLLYRKQMHLHKRFMLMAALTMIPASVTRIAFLGIIPIDGTLLTLLTTYILWLTPVVMDRLIFKAVHPVFKWGVPVYIVTQIICIGFMPSTGIGRAIAFPFALQ